MNMKIRYFALGSFAYLILIATMWVVLIALIINVFQNTIGTIEIMTVISLFIILILLTLYFIFGGLKQTLTVIELNSEYIKIKDSKVYWKEVVNTTEKMVPNFMGGLISGYEIKYIEDEILYSIPLVKTKNTMKFMTFLIENSILNVE